jgi:hypothetical protein
MINLKFSGSVGDAKEILQMQEEFTDISEISGWKYALVSEDFRSMALKAKKEMFLTQKGGAGAQDAIPVPDTQVYLEGISLFIAPNMDALRLTFDRENRLATIAFSAAESSTKNGKVTVRKFEFLYYPHIKLITNNYENHIKAVKILDYVKKKYISNLHVTDSSGFWENRDEEELKVMFWKQKKDREIII